MYINCSIDNKFLHYEEKIKKNYRAINPKNICAHDTKAYRCLVKLYSSMHDYYYTKNSFSSTLDYKKRKNLYEEAVKNATNILEIKNILISNSNFEIFDSIEIALKCCEIFDDKN